VEVLENFIIVDFWEGLKIVFRLSKKSADGVSGVSRFSIIRGCPGFNFCIEALIGKICVEHVVIVIGREYSSEVGYDLMSDDSLILTLGTVFDHFVLVGLLLFGWLSYDVQW